MLARRRAEQIIVHSQHVGTLMMQQLGGAGTSPWCLTSRSARTSHPRWPKRRSI
jgi:hypothetical protein